MLAQIPMKQFGQGQSKLPDVNSIFSRPGLSNWMVKWFAIDGGLSM